MGQGVPLVIQSAKEMYYIYLWFKILQWQSMCVTIKKKGFKRNNPHGFHVSDKYTYLNMLARPAAISNRVYCTSISTGCTLPAGNPSAVPLWCTPCWDRVTPVSVLSVWIPPSGSAAPVCEPKGTHVLPNSSLIPTSGCQLTDCPLWCPQNLYGTNKIKVSNWYISKYKYMDV